MGVLSAVWYVVLKFTSEAVYWDAIAALGLMIAFYYGLTGYACAIYYRHRLLRSVKNFVFMGVLPLAGGLTLTWAFVQSVIDLSDPANSTTGVAWFGVSAPLAITIAFTVLGLILMVLWQWRQPDFFRGRPEVFEEPEPERPAPLRHAPQP
jgi:hypothetical protein